MPKFAPGEYLFASKNFMSTLVIIESGSTKTTYVCVHNGKVEQRWVGSGLNPVTMERDVLKHMLTADWAKGNVYETPDHVVYFGAGCGLEKYRNIIQEEVSNITAAKQVKVMDDLLAAAIALFERGEGIACILGTGSNCGYFSDGRLQLFSPSLGYVIGDEGGGDYLGRKLISAYFYGKMSPVLQEQFEAAFPRARLEEVIQRVYQDPGAARYLASFAPFGAAHREHPFIQNLILDTFRDFFDGQFSAIKSSELRDAPLGFVGSIAAIFSEELHHVANEQGLTIAKIIKDPVDNLIKHYSNGIND